MALGFGCGRYPESAWYNYLFGQATASEVTEHLKACEPCAAAIAELRRTGRSLAALPKDERAVTEAFVSSIVTAYRTSSPARRVKGRFTLRCESRQWLLYAAAAAFAVLVLINPPGADPMPSQPIVASSVSKLVESPPTPTLVIVPHGVTYGPEAGGGATASTAVPVRRPAGSTLGLERASF